MSTPLILITNDDGYQATGIQALAKTVAPLGDIYVVAPDGARSGTACAISSGIDVTFHKVSEQGSIHVFACSGTPVDCVKLAMEQVVPRRPDLVLSGINHGDNASISIHYSGTMGAVLEACMKGIPAIGLSLYLHRGERYEDYAVSAPTLDAIRQLCQRVMSEGLPQDVCLNINLPQSATFRGWKACRMTRGQWTAEWDRATTPEGRPCFRLTGQFTDLEPEATDTDFAALREGYCSIVPIQIDMTAHAAMQHVRQLLTTT